MLNTPEQMVFSREELDRLASRANSGDYRAISLLVKHLLSETRGMAFTLARNAIDAEDLQAAAIENLIRLWKQGSGPTTGPVPYIIQSMRNRMIDEFRSPRSKTANLAPTFEIPDLEDPTHLSDLRNEAELVRKALHRLSSDHRYLLVEVYGGGRKPTEVGKDMGRSADGVFSLHRRAKIALKRAVLIEVLLPGAGEACEQAAEALPQRVEDSPEHTKWGTQPQLHYFTCRQCRARWAKFATIGGTLGLVGILPAALTQSAGVSLATAAEPLNAVASTLATAKSGALSSLRGRRPGLIGKHTRAIVRVLATGLIIGPVVMMLSGQVPLAAASAAPGNLSMTLTHGEVLEVKTTFNVPNTEWVHEEFVIHYPPGLAWIPTDSTKQCTDIGRKLVCEDTGSRPLNYTFQFRGSPGNTEPVSIDLTAATKSHRYTGSASSLIPKQDQTLKTTARTFEHKQ